MDAVMCYRKRFFSIVSTLVLVACTHFSVPETFHFQEIPTSFFSIASWQKITDIEKPIRIYFEGDGYAFNAHGRVSQNPTPRGTTLREIAFNDPAPNVVYLARPCQYLQNDRCDKRYWTDARYAPEIIVSTAQAIQSFSSHLPMIFIGYSGGAQVSGLVAVTNPQFKVKKLVTIAGNLDHSVWTKKYHLDPLVGSMDLRDYRERYLMFDQIHFVGDKDTVIDPSLVKDFVGSKVPVVTIKGVRHAEGWQAIRQQIYSQ